MTPSVEFEMSCEGLAMHAKMQEFGVEFDGSFYDGQTKCVFYGGIREQVNVYQYFPFIWALIITFDHDLFAVKKGSKSLKFILILFNCYQVVGKYFNKKRRRKL